MTVKIFGTNHLMKKEEIEEIIRIEKPDIIGVELCKTRLDLMVLGKGNKPEDSPEEIEKKEETLIGKISGEIKKKAEEEKNKDR